MDLAIVVFLQQSIASMWDITKRTHFCVVVFQVSKVIVGHDSIFIDFLQAEEQRIHRHIIYICKDTK